MGYAPPKAVPDERYPHRARQFDLAIMYLPTGEETYSGVTPVQWSVNHLRRLAGAGSVPYIGVALTKFG